MMNTEQSLNKLLSRRSWYKNSGIKGNTARVYKKRFRENKLDLETQVKLLQACGFKLVQEMQWDEENSREKIITDLVRKLHMEHAFWSLNQDTLSHIPDDLLIEKVLLHLYIDEIKILFTLFEKKRIKRYWKEKMLPQEPLYHNLNRLYAFLFFGIKNPDRYIRDAVSKRYNTIQCKD